MTSTNPPPAAMSGSMTAPLSSAMTANVGIRSATPSGASHAATQQGAQNFSSLVSTVVETTGNVPPSLVGPSTTVVGDTLFVFGGRSLARSRAQLSSEMYALDLITRLWRKLETRGTIPPPRYFHSMCALGESKLICFGGMSPAETPSVAPGADPQNEVMVMSDLHVFDIPTCTWSHIPTANPPEGRYAHCVTILPTSAMYSSAANAAAPLLVSGVGQDGYGAAEMVVVGGQDSANRYIEELNVFNLRSMQWGPKSKLENSCGAYRSVVAPLGRNLKTSDIGAGRTDIEENVSLSAIKGATPSNPNDEGAMLIYSNYNFLSVKLELQIRYADGTLIERPMNSVHKPPGLRFPNGGVLDNHFDVSGTYLTSSKQEYALWALDLRTLEWLRIDAGSVFQQGSWGRGFVWSRRNCFVILGDKSRVLVEDYNNRRINFSNLCIVELEAFGFYENHRKTTHPHLQKTYSSHAEELGRIVMQMKEMADMEFVAVGGERVPVNSRIVGKRWGPYFLELLNATHPNPPMAPTSSTHRAVSMATITQSSYSQPPSAMPPTAAGFDPLDRPRTLYMPHTHQTLLTLVHFLYTGALPRANTPQSTPQILCSLLQLARPYRIDGLLEAVVERLHQVLDGKNAAAVFNAAAMAAGGGDGVFVVNDSEVTGDDGDLEEMVWKGGLSDVIGLQKRGLRGLMEGRRLRERGRSLGGQSTHSGGGSMSLNYMTGREAGMQGTFGAS